MATASKPIDDVYLRDVMGPYLVQCPRCSGGAKVEVKGEYPDAEAALYCEGCGHFDKKEIYSKANRLTFVVGHSVDPYYHLSLLLQTGCCGSVLWAYNWRHLQFIEDVVSAKLRKTNSIRRCPTPLSQRLPKWMLSRKHRDEVLRAIRRIKAKL